MNSVEINPVGPEYRLNRLYGTDCYKIAVVGNNSMYLEVFKSDGERFYGYIKGKMRSDGKYVFNFREKRLVFELEIEIIPVYGNYDDLEFTDGVNREYEIRCFRFVGYE
jgi:hypothetical protein